MLARMMMQKRLNIGMIDNIKFPFLTKINNSK